MKKILVFCLTLLLTLSFTSCASNKNSEDDNSSKEKTVTDEIVTHFESPQEVTEDVKPSNESSNNIQTEYKNIQDFVIFGLNSFDNLSSKDADTFLALIIDETNNKVKIVSIDKKSCLEIKGHNKDSLSNAYFYGSQALSIQSINMNLGLQITEYISAADISFSQLVNEIGGIEIEIDDKEKEQINDRIIPQLINSGVKCKKINATGKQILVGEQAVCYSKIADSQSSERQIEIITAVFNKIKTINKSKIMSFANNVLPFFNTSLDLSESMNFLLWLCNENPSIESIFLPDTNYNVTSEQINDGVCLVYDLARAKKEIKAFLAENNQ